MIKSAPGKARILMLLATAALVLPLGACQTTTAAQARQDQVSAALGRAADQASSKGETAQSLTLLEHIYERDSGNAEAALKYAAALREAGRLNRAAMVLAPFAQGDKGDSGINTEYAAIQAAMGDYLTAETHARQAILQNPDSAEAYHVLGIALDAQGQNKPAEEAFRKALEGWEGDPTPVLNNLGLNLASQGFIDEAIDTLRKAAALSPTRTEIERNLRIVSALQTQPPKDGWRLMPPVPKRKPEQPT